MMTLAVDPICTMESQDSALGLDTTVITPPSSPKAASEAADQLFSKVQSTYCTLSGLKSLAPDEQINQQLTELVSLCVKPYDDAFVNYFFNIPGAEILCSRLRKLLSEAEGELEKYWAVRIVQSSKTLSGI